MKEFAVIVLCCVSTFALGEGQSMPTASTVDYTAAAAEKWECRDHIRKPLIVTIPERQAMEYLVHEVKPVAPTGAEPQTVYIQFLFDPQGFVVCARPLEIEGASSDATFRSNSLEAVKQWRFKTLYRKMKPVVAETVVAFQFKP